MKTGTLEITSRIYGNPDWQSLVKDKDLTAPPGSPTKNDRYIVGASATGAWSGHDADIAQYNGSAWEFVSKRKGLACYVEDEDKIYYCTGSAWEIVSGLSTNTIDNFTILLESEKIKVAERIELNIFLLAYRLAVANSITKFSMNDGMSDEFEDETGVDTAGSTHEIYNETYDYYTNEQTDVGIDSDVKFISHLNGPNGAKEIVDDGNTGHVVTQYGNAVLSTAQKKFGSTALLLDGTGDYLKVVDSDDWSFGTGNMTIDFWVYFNSTAGTQYFCKQGLDDSGADYFAFRWNGSQIEFFAEWDLFAYNNPLVGTYTFSTGTWYHVALVRNVNTFTIYVNGTDVGHGDDSNSWPTDYAGTFQIGCIDGANCLNGYIDEFRVSKGIARWTSGFTPSTSEYSSDSYTKLLLHMNTLDISDSHHILTFEGGAVLSTAQKKFGTASLSLGSGKRVTVPDSADWDFGSGDFTVDCRIRFNSTSNQWKPICGQYTGSSNSWCFYVEYNTIRFRYSTDGSNDTVLQVNWTASTDTWYHIAVVRSGTDLMFFVDGTQVGSTQTLSATIYNSNTILEIGTFYNNNFGYIDGYIDELRLSKGIARWTSNFTPATAEYDTIGTIYDMVLKSNSYTATAAPTKARLVLFQEDVDSITLNTDLKGYVSRDGGTTYSQVTLADEGYYESGKRILSCAPLDISGQPSGTSMKWKVETANTKRVKLHGTGMSWN